MTETRKWQRGKPRGRFDIMCVFDDGSYVRFTSHKERSLSPDDIVRSLRKYADHLEHGIDEQTPSEGR